MKDACLLAKLEGALHSDTAFEHSMPLWLRIAHTRLCLSVKALHTCLLAGQDKPSTVHLPLFHAVQILSPLRICVALLEPMPCPLPFAFFCFFGWVVFRFGLSVTVGATLRRLFCFVRTVLVGLAVSVGSGRVLRLTVCGSQNIARNSHTVCKAAPKVIPSDSRYTLAHLARSSPSLSSWSRSVTSLVWDLHLAKY